MESNYIQTIQEKIEQVKQNIDNLEKEAISFSIAKKEMQEAVEEFKGMVKQFREVLVATLVLNDEVNKISVESTLKKLDNSAALINQDINNVIESNKLVIESNFEYMQGSFVEMTKIAQDINKRNKKFVIIISLVSIFAVAVSILFSFL